MILGILGTGNMAEALIAGILKKKVLKPHQITGFDVDGARLRLMAKKYKIRSAKSAPELVNQSSTVLLAVKPQQLENLLQDIYPFLKSHHLLLSIAAGIDISFIEKRIPPYSRVIRLMPNTPALIGLGATVFYSNKNCKKDDCNLTEKIFGAVGNVWEVSRESLLDAVTGLSGSGPAYVYFFTQALINGGIKAGLSSKLARELSIQTIFGAANLLKQSRDEPAELISKVASKGGTTEAGLKILQKKRFGKIIEETVLAATRRARKLRK